MIDDRGEVQAEGLLRIVLVLVVVWLALEIVGEVFEIAAFVLGPLQPLLGLVVIVLVVAWLLDYI